MNIDYSLEAPVVSGRLTPAQIEELVSKPMGTKPDKKFFIAISISLTFLLIGAVLLGYTFYYGIGVWGNNQPVGWGFGIVNFVFWVGIGHAGTLISAILFLLRQKWRTGIARFA
ncbi:MAG TPA: hydrogenase, partial [Ignavibacteriaceae bacterium]|nr:hydrogenase [Ignavibacteriaceae bacterium]